MSKKVVVGMSGGVDSSVAALLLKQQGYEVVGLFMRNWHEQDDSGCCTAESDFLDVRRVCSKLSIPYFVVDFSKEYWDNVFLSFIEEYKKGRTPNPDIMCNREIKFECFRKYALELGADYIATGHYAHLENKDGVNYLLRSLDENKDQTYFLCMLKNQQLDNVIFPLGNINKKDVRAIAKENGLKTADKKDSTGVCFIGERRFREFLSQYIPMKKGEIRTLDQKVVGEHNGVFYYTIGQRKGLGIGGGGNGEPYFVIDKDVQNNILYVSQGEAPQLFSSSITIPQFNFISQKLADGKYDALTRIRHREPLKQTVIEVSGDSVKINFEEPERGVALGQYAVCYIERQCLGGGVIEQKVGV